MWIFKVAAFKAVASSWMRSQRFFNNQCSTSSDLTSMTQKHHGVSELHLMRAGGGLLLSKSALNGMPDASSLSGS